MYTKIQHQRMSQFRYPNRAEAGRVLAEVIRPYIEENSLVIGLPRGGVVVASEVARHYRFPLSITVTRKLGAPMNREYAIGAISEAKIVVFDRHAIEQLDVQPKQLIQALNQEERELKRQELLYKEEVPLITGKSILLIDDGSATGLTAKAAILSLRKQGASKIVFAAPVCSRFAEEEIAKVADATVCIQTPQSFEAVGDAYEDFTQVTDEEVTRHLSRYRVS